MTKMTLEDSKFIKELHTKFDEFKKSVYDDLEKIKKIVEKIEKNNNKNKKITEYDVEIAWVKLRLDYLTGVRKMSSERFNNLKKYMSNIDLENIPFEIKYYIKEEK